MHGVRVNINATRCRADFYMTQASMQALLSLFAALAPIGRLLGYEPLRNEARRGVRTVMAGSVAVGSGLLFLTVLMLRWLRQQRWS
jgi:uncharacterized membrane protein YhiD involved in acid resistance